MAPFAIIEVDDGLTVTELGSNESPEDAALSRGGVVVDPGPYHSYHEACDALLALEDESEDEQQGA